MTPSTASPKAEPPPSTTASTRSTRLRGSSRSVSRVPGLRRARRRPATAPPLGGATTTVTPVSQPGSSWVQWPTRTPATSTSEFVGPGRAVDVTADAAVTGVPQVELHEPPGRREPEPLVELLRPRVRGVEPDPLDVGGAGPFDHGLGQRPAHPAVAALRGDEEAADVEPADVLPARPGQARMRRVSRMPACSPRASAIHVGRSGRSASHASTNRSR